MRDLGPEFHTLFPITLWRPQFSSPVLITPKSDNSLLSNLVRGLFLGTGKFPLPLCLIRHLLPSVSMVDTGELVNVLTLKTVKTHKGETYTTYTHINIYNW